MQLFSAHKKCHHTYALNRPSENVMAILRNLLICFPVWLFALESTAQGAPSNTHETAAPFGIRIGQTSCADAARRLQPTVQNRQNSAVAYTVQNPGRHYEGARTIMFVCETENRPVILLSLVVDKGGVGSPAVAEAFKHLASKYRLVHGGRPPSVGNGHARFDAGMTIIELEVQHLSFQFSIGYFERNLHTRTMESMKNEARQATERRRGSL